jgi:hypothetical protein
MRGLECILNNFYDRNRDSSKIIVKMIVITNSINKLLNLLHGIFIGLDYKCFHHNIVVNSKYKDTIKN